MPASVRSGRSQHNRLRRRAQVLGEEVDRLGIGQEGSLAPDLKIVGTPQTQDGFNIENFLDKALDLTKGWEKIAALVALITTNLSGNKSLGALLEIMSKDKAIKGMGVTGDGQSPSPGALNIGDLLTMAENILKTGQLPPALMGMQPPAAEAPSTGTEVVVEVPEATVQPADEAVTDTIDIEPETVVVREDSGAFEDGLDS